MPDKPDFYSFLGGLYIKGGLASDIDVDHWRWARKLMEPFFSLKNIKSWIQISHEESLHTAEYLQKYASSGESFLPLKTLRLFGMHVVGRAFFGSNLQSFSPKEKETALDNVEKMFEHFLHRVLVPITKNLLIYSLIGLRRKENILMKQLVRDIDKILEEKISRIKAGIDVSEDDYLTKLMREPELYMEVRQQAGTIMNSPDYFDLPHVYDPDRWLPDKVAQRDPHCFLPFSSGPRRCMGGRFTMQEMRIFLATMLRQFEILPSDQCKTMRDVKFEMNGTLKLKDNCQIRLRSRKPNLGI
ncbi:hypothetical protein M8J76_002507 [Diaphorina citri]|nr:hypothetical protein M8J76_002507 [Diaphorina citri]